MKRKLLNYLGLLGVISFLSYLCAVVFSPLAYPGYNWMKQAVSDLSATNSPSLTLWNQLSSFYNVCEVMSIMFFCYAIQNRKTKLFRIGVYLFCIMEWTSAVGYRMFPLTDSGYANTFQDVMHIIITVIVVLLSISSLVIIILSGIKDKTLKSYSICAIVSLLMMFIGAIGMKIVPEDYFGIVERFSVFAATGFNMALGIHLFNMELD